MSEETGPGGPVSDRAAPERAVSDGGAADPAVGGRPFSRRAFLGGAAGVAGTIVLGWQSESGLVGLRAFAAPLVAEAIQPPSRVPDFTIAAERDIDLFLADFRLYGFKLQKVKGVPTLVPTVTNNVITVTLPPQAIGEAVYPVSPGNDTLPAVPLMVDPPPVASAVAGPTRLVFTLANGVTIPLPTMTVADLLDWRPWTLVVPPPAQISPPPPGAAHPLPGAPGAFATSIEFPYALYLAPVVWVSGPASTSYQTWFATRAKPLRNGAVTDLWSADLTRGPTAGRPRAKPPAPSVSAVFASDFVFDGAPTDATPADVIYYGIPIQ